MELQFEKRELSCLAQAVSGQKEQELTQEIRLSDDLPDVGRVLAGWGQVILRGKEWQGSRMAAAGGVQTSLLYAPEDGTEPRKVETWIPFQIKWDGAEAELEGPMRILPTVRFVEGRNLSARKLLIRVGLSCQGEGLCACRAQISVPASIPEDVELLRRSYPVRLPREAGEKTFALEQTLQVGPDPVAEILAYTLQPEITEARVAGDKAVLRGLGRLHLVYRCREGRIRCRLFEIPISQLAELERVYDQDPQADVLVAVTGLELEMEEENPMVKANLVAQYLISDRTMLELVEDAYSPRREVGIRQEELHLPLILDETRDRISAQAVCGEMAEGLDGTFWAGPPQLRREGDRVEVEIPGRFQLLGLGTDGTVRSAAPRWTGKAALTADPSSRLDSVTAVTGEPQWVSTGSGMELRGELELRTVTRCRRGMPMITGLELGSLRQSDESRPTLILCRPGSRGLWDIAKGAGASVSAIRRANGLTAEPEADRMLLIPIP